MANLKKRLDAVGGQCRIESSPGRGTSVEMTIHVKTQTSPIMAIGGNEMPD
jgi:signal transduction histidine kinase